LLKTESISSLLLNLNSGDTIEKDPIINATSVMKTYLFWIILFCLLFHWKKFFWQIMKKDPKSPQHIPSKAN